MTGKLFEGSCDAKLELLVITGKVEGKRSRKKQRENMLDGLT